MDHAIEMAAVRPPATSDPSAGASGGVTLERLSLAALALAHFGVCVALGGKLNVWMDEAYSLGTTAGTLAESLRRAVTFELQAPVYFGLLCAWRSVSSSILWARLLSASFSTATVVLVPAIWRRTGARSSPIWITALVASHPLVLWAATEIRLYALVILLSAALLLTFWDGYLTEPARGRARIWHAGLAVVALYTQYYLALLLAAQGVALLVTRRWSALRSMVPHMLVVGVCFGPMLVFLPRQVAFATSAPQRPGFLDTAKLFYERAAHPLLPRMSASARPWKWAQKSLFLAGILWLGVRAFTTSKRSSDEPDPAPWVVMAGAVLAIFGGVYQMVRTSDLVNVAHMACAFLPVLLAAGLLVDRLAGPRAWMAAALVAGVFDVSASTVQFAPLAKKGDWQHLAAALEEREAAGQPVLVYPSPSVFPLALYYRGANALVPLPRPSREDVYTLEDSVLHDPEELEHALNALPGHPERVWLAVEAVGAEYCGVHFHPDVLESFVQRRFEVEERLDFFGSSLRLLRRKEP